MRRAHQKAPHQTSDHEQSQPVQRCHIPFVEDGALLVHYQLGRLLCPTLQGREEEDVMIDKGGYVGICTDNTSGNRTQYCFSSTESLTMRGSNGSTLRTRSKDRSSSNSFLRISSGRSSFSFDRQLKSSTWRMNKSQIGSGYIHMHIHTLDDAYFVSEPGEIKARSTVASLFLHRGKTDNGTGSCSGARSTFRRIRNFSLVQCKLWSSLMAVTDTRTLALVTIRYSEIIWKTRTIQELSVPSVMNLQPTQHRCHGL